MIRKALKRVAAKAIEVLPRGGRGRAAEPFAPRPGEPFPAGAHPLDWKRSGLNAFGRKMCASFLEALLCDDDGKGGLVPPGPAVVERVVHKMDLWLGSNSQDLSRAFVVLCGALQGSPALMIKRPIPFTRLPLEKRLHVLELLEDHENGLYSMLLTAFKVPLATAAFEEGEMLAETGFSHPDLIASRPRLKKPVAAKPTDAARDEER